MEKTETKNPVPEGDWHKKDIALVAEELGTSVSTGLSEEEALRRLSQYGPNRIREVKKEGKLQKFLKQFTEFIILVLIGAAIIAGLLGEWIDSLAILAIVLLNGIIGYIQEEKAEKVLESLKKLAAPMAKVIRDGELRHIKAEELVPGDLIVIEAGDMIPADARLVEAEFLQVDEAPLTGESHAVTKDTATLRDHVPLADRLNMLFSGTTAVYGKAKAIVVATGMHTEIGKIATMLEEVKPEPTPLQKRLAEFGRLLVYIAGAVCALIFFIGVMRGDPVLEMFLVAISLAVAAIPEGLPAVVTIVLALGVQRMVKRHALIRKLPSVETLGSATIVASDKTGTLTQNQMTVKKLYLPDGRVVDVSGAGYEPVGSFFVDGKEIEPSSDDSLKLLFEAAVLCNTAVLKKTEDGWKVIGDPTEGALITMAYKAGLKKEELEDGFSFVAEIPFDAERKRMTRVYKNKKDGLWYAFTKGAVEVILSRCTHVYIDGKVKELDEATKKKILEANQNFAHQALRVLAIAVRTSENPLDVHRADSVETELTFLGLTGMIDPPREEVFLAVEKAKRAGMIPIMITGDHKETAVAIAKEIGIFDQGDMALTGQELDGMNEEEFKRLLPKIKVYARVNPEHKLKIVRAWKERGDIIAMTGDGVNDAPALKEADIGIAMGITGTDVTKSVADMVLTDDNFASIVAAVEEGRGIFDNIRKVVHFLLSCNIGEILVLLVASIVGMPLPLLPVQILWTNLVTDGLPALGLAMEKVDPTVMERKPRPKDEGIVTTRLLMVMTLQGAFMAVCTLAVYWVDLYILGASVEEARTIAFATLVFSQKFHVFNCRSEWQSIFELGPFTNRMLNLAVVLILVTQVLITHIPQLQPIFKVTPLSPAKWLLVLIASVQPLIWMEIIKFMYKKSGRQLHQH